jgi:hypothetical protein
MLAQLVEQRTFNPFVVGSTPAHPTIILKALCISVQSAFLFGQNKQALKLVGLSACFVWLQQGKSMMNH